MMELMNFQFSEEMLDQSFKAIILLGVKHANYSKDIDTIVQSVLNIMDEVNQKIVGKSLSDTADDKITKVTEKIHRLYPILVKEGSISADGKIPDEELIPITLLENMFKMFGVEFESMKSKKSFVQVDPEVLDNFKDKLRKALLEDYNDYVDDDIDMWKELSINAPTTESVGQIIEDGRRKLSISSREFDKLIKELHEEVAQQLKEQQER